MLVIEHTTNTTDLPQSSDECTGIFALAHVLEHLAGGDVVAAGVGLAALH